MATSESESSAESATAVVVSRADGQIVAQNAAARRLVGAGVGRCCWDVVGGLDGAKGLPCGEGCVGRLIELGAETDGAHTTGEVRDLLKLRCVPVDGHVVSLLAGEPSSAPKSWERLTPREVDVLELLADGRTTREISARLGITEATVRAHVEHMRARLGVKTRAALVARGFRLNYVD